METVDVDDIVCVIKNEKDLVSNWERFLNDLQLKKIGEKEKAELKATFGQSRDHITLLRQILLKWVLENKNGATVKNFGEVLKRSEHPSLKHKLTTTFQPNNVIVTANQHKNSSCPEKLLQIINWSKGGGKEECQLYLPNLLSLLTQIGSRPAAMISISGSTSPTKSFLADQIIKYFKFGCKGDPAWSQKRIENGFQSNAGDFERATGIRIWNEPFYVEKNDKEIGVIVMEIHEKFETFDFEKDFITTALSLLISSITYFVANDVKQPVEWFKKYLSANEPKEYPKRLFQNLTILCNQEGKGLQPNQLKAKLLNEATTELPTSLVKYFEEVKCEVLNLDHASAHSASNFSRTFSSCPLSVKKIIEQEFSLENIVNLTKQLFDEELTGNNLKEFTCLWAHLATTYKEKIRPLTILYKTEEIFGSVFTEKLLNKYRKSLESLRYKNAPELEAKFDKLQTKNENELINELMSITVHKSIMDSCKVGLSSKMDALKYNFLKEIKNESTIRMQTTSKIIEYDETAVIGRGSMETVVYKGTFGENPRRPVAVKRLNAVHFDIENANTEIKILIDCDSHNNVVKCFHGEKRNDCFLIALELCDCTLDAWVRREAALEVEIDPSDILLQTTEGVAYLHKKQVIHRDLKPQNILLLIDSSSKNVCVKISDFGISKKISGQGSSATVTSRSGTEGWMAPEILQLERSEDGGNISGRMTTASDIFSLGCVFYYVLSEGSHPFGEDYRRQVNIIEGNPSICEDNVEEHNRGNLRLVEKMISKDPNERPKISYILSHPLLWNNKRTLQFLVDISNCTENKPAGKSSCSLPDDEVKVKAIMDELEINAKEKIGVVISNPQGWISSVADSKHLFEFLTKTGQIKYKGQRVKELIRAIRNMQNHYKNVPRLARSEVGSMPDDFIRFWTSRFPILVPYTWETFGKLDDKEKYGLEDYYHTS